MFWLRNKITTTASYLKACPHTFLSGAATAAVVERTWMTQLWQRSCIQIVLLFVVGNLPAKNSASGHILSAIITYKCCNGFNSSYICSPSLSQWTSPIQVQALSLNWFRTVELNGKISFNSAVWKIFFLLYICILLSTDLSFMPVLPFWVNELVQYRCKHLVDSELSNLTWMEN